MRARGSGRIFRQTHKAKDGTRQEGDTYGIRYYNRRIKDHDYEYGFATEAAAEARLREIQVDQARGILVGHAYDRLPFDDLASMIKTDYTNNKKKSLQRVECHIEHLKTSFGGMRGVDITTDRIGQHVSRRIEEGASNGTINRELTSLKRMFTLATRAKRFSKDAVPHIPMLAEDNVRTGFFEEPQLQAILPHLRPKHRRVVMVAYITGWRTASEILTRQKHHVDFDAGWLRLDPGETKTRKGRMFPLDIDPRLRQVLEEAIAVTERLKKRRGIISPWVFTSSNGRRRMRSFYTAWRKACVKAGVPGRLIHDLRRTAVRNLVRYGMTKVVIKQIVGFRSDSIFERYAIVEEGMIREAAAKVRARVIGA